MAVSFEVQTGRSLRNVWEVIADDYLDCSGVSEVKGSEVQHAVMDYVYMYHGNDEWYKKWEELPIEERRRLVKETFPDNTTWGY